MKSKLLLLKKSILQHTILIHKEYSSGLMYLANNVAAGTEPDRFGCPLAITLLH